ncbi:MAG: hypothetical protein FJ309_05835 [Planctomycetes bacterium]|nr:hypothetical protein [Planctomycetota bacterium]
MIMTAPGNRTGVLLASASLVALALCCGCSGGNQAASVPKRQGGGANLRPVGEGSPPPAAAAGTPAQPPSRGDSVSDKPIETP